MLALAAREMGYKVQTFSPERNSPTGQIADLEWVAQYNDLDAIRAFARGVDVVTFEFENVAIEAVNAASEFSIVRPAGNVLHTAQHRLREKTWLSENGFPVAPFRHVKTEADVRSAINELGLPVVLKTAGFGYDGKGQVKINSVEEIATATLSVKGVDSIVEQFIRFEREVSVVAARGVDGSYVDYGVFENIHRDHILDTTLAPGRVARSTTKRATEIARGILESLDVVGILCVEFFETGAGELIVNELAPRTHNSGHLTIDSHVTSQFEQQLRAVFGLPLGSIEQFRPAVMINLLGDLWDKGTPKWDVILSDSNVKLHLYGKAQARRGRKMGHLTILSGTIDEALAKAAHVRTILGLSPLNS
jgi:5-(carboxyamino)imidazole ribonucleotide synthase